MRLKRQDSSGNSVAIKISASNKNSSSGNRPHSVSKNIDSFLLQQGDWTRWSSKAPSQSLIFCDWFGLLNQLCPVSFPDQSLQPAPKRVMTTTVHNCTKPAYLPSAAPLQSCNWLNLNSTENARFTKRQNSLSVRFWSYKVKSERRNTTHQLIISMQEKWKSIFIT